MRFYNVGYDTCEKKRDIALKRLPHTNALAFCLVSVAFLMLFFSSLLYGQTAGFVSYNMDDGLPSIYTTSLSLDKAGNMWIGTINGLARFNGKNFQSYYTTHGLAENSIRTTLYDSKGRLWLGHDNGEVTVYDGRRFTTFPSDVPIQRKAVLCIYEDKQGSIWIGSLGGGVARYRNGSFTSLNRKDGLSGEGVFAILQDKKGIYWFGTENGITTMSLTDEKPSFSYINTATGFPSNLIRSLAEDRAGIIWIGTKDAGIIKYLPPKKDAEKGAYLTFSKQDGLPENFIYTLYVDNSDILWGGTFGGGACRYIPPSKGNPKGRFVVYTKSNGLIDNYVLSIVKDYHGRIWFATSGGGISHIKDDLFRLYSAKDGLPGSVQTVLQDRQGVLWLGTNEGLVRFTFAPMSDKPLVKKYSIREGLSGKNITALTEDADGKLWVSTRESGVTLLNPATSAALPLGDKSGMDKNILTLLADNATVWLGSNGHGLSRYDIRSRHIQTFTTKDGLPNNTINAAYKDAKGIVWFATAKGLARYDGKFFTSIPKLKDVALTSITEDQTGSLWIGSEGKGLFKLSGNSLEQFTGRDGMSSNYVLSVVYGGNNTLWLGNSSGTDRFDIVGSTFFHYGQDEGFLGGESSRNALIRDNQGIVWFGTAAGVVQYDPRNDRFIQISSPAAFPLANLRVLLRDTSLPQNAQLSSDQNYLTFDLGDMGSHADVMRYQYKLEGYDKNWLSVSDKHSITYRDLPYGKYSFKVRAGLKNGTWMALPTTYEFEILPPLWQTPWFIITMSCSVVIVVFGVALVRIRQEKRHNHILEKKVQERTSQLEEQKGQLLKEKDMAELINTELEKARQEAETASKAKSEFIANITHELRTPMNSIIGFTRRILTRHEQQLDGTIRGELEIVYRNSHRLLTLINDILDISKVEAGKITYNIQVCNVQTICQEIIKEFLPLAETKHIALHLNGSDPYPVYCDPDRLRQILLNLISNGIKFTERGSVQISLDKTVIKNVPYVSVTVRDTGMGIPSDKWEMIFSAFEQANPSRDQLKGGIGLGLAIAKKLAVDMGGDILLESKIGQGSIFTLLLPPGNNDMELYSAPHEHGTGKIPVA